MVSNVMLQRGEHRGEEGAEVAAVVLLLGHHRHVLIGLGAQHREVLSTVNGALGLASRAAIVAGEIDFYVYQYRIL